jgi:photosystem II stability/assembly factor-like uncharacterized protein
MWTNDGGPFGGRVQAIERIDTNSVVAGTRDGGVFISHDAGDSWQTANHGLGNLIISCISINPDNNNTAYLGTEGDGVYRTNNLNGTPVWVKFSNGVSNNSVLCSAISAQDTARVYAGTVNGMFSSTTCGSLWTDISGDLTSKTVNAIVLFSDPLKIMVGTMGGIFKTTDGGVSWVLKNNGVTSPFISSLRVDPADERCDVRFGGCFQVN